MEFADRYLALNAKKSPYHIGESSVTTDHHRHVAVPRATAQLGFGGSTGLAYDPGVCR